MNSDPFGLKPKGSTYNSSKKLAKSLLNSLGPRLDPPARDWVIRFFARRKGAYPPGWRQILSLEKYFMPEVGGCDVEPVPSICSKIPTGWKLMKGDS